MFQLRTWPFSKLNVPLVSNQPQYSMLWRVIEAQVVPACEKLGMGQIVWSPMAQGVLSGKYVPGQPPPAGRLGNSLETLRSMVASGLGVTVLPKTALTERYATPLVKAVPFAEPRPKRRVAVAWRRRETGEGERPKAVRKLIEAVKAADLPVELLGGAE